ncbi:oxygen-independent coproporphyrinogen III oxidase [Burkholderiaceae bacterium DAT-1]|nr:oxygen-independent coproporphyrinogen III oxidase [Burkholderiaceae bacterium DAT-1]
MNAPAGLSQHIQFDRSLIERMSASGPRYTSYPTADRFHGGFAEADYRRLASMAFSESEHLPLSLYVHIPFCNTVCYYCGCNKIITNNKARADQYLDYLQKEIELQAPLFKGRSRVEQLHFGGGTPTFLSDEQLTRLMNLLHQQFAFADDETGEYSIEIDPRKVSADTVRLLRSLGFNRMSVGVQDFDPKVQAAVNRIQSEAETRLVIDTAREAGFKSVSIDLIYGLPEQSEASFNATLDKIIEIRPDRLSVYHYAHLPQMFKVQRQIDESTLPASDTKLSILANTISKLTEAGYVYIGMDHFALPEDELAKAQRAGTLHRNFQGYSTHDDIDLVALGVSAIGKIGPSYSQNEKEIEAYYAALDAGRLPIFRGMELDTDDRIRRDLIQHLMCDFRLDFNEIGTRWHIDTQTYFATEQAKLAEFEGLGLIQQQDGVLVVSEKGRLLVRNIATAFDRHLREREKAGTFSKLV